MVPIEQDKAEVAKKPLDLSSKDSLPNMQSTLQYFCLKPVIVLPNLRTGSRQTRVIIPPKERSNLPVWFCALQLLEAQLCQAETTPFRTVPLCILGKVWRVLSSTL